MVNSNTYYDIDYENANASSSQLTQIDKMPSMEQQQQENMDHVQKM